MDNFLFQSRVVDAFLYFCRRLRRRWEFWLLIWAVSVEAAPKPLENSRPSSLSLSLTLSPSISLPFLRQVSTCHLQRRQAAADKLTRGASGCRPHRQTDATSYPTPGGLNWGVNVGRQGGKRTRRKTEERKKEKKGGKNLRKAALHDETSSRQAVSLSALQPYQLTLLDQKPLTSVEGRLLPLFFFFFMTSLQWVRRCEGGGGFRVSWLAECPWQNTGDVESSLAVKGIGTERRRRGEKRKHMAGWGEAEWVCKTHTWIKVMFKTQMKVFNFCERCKAPEKLEESH